MLAYFSRNTIEKGAIQSCYSAMRTDIPVRSCITVKHQGGMSGN